MCVPAAEGTRRQAIRSNSYSGLHSGTFTEESLIGVAKFMRRTTVYEILGDWPWALASLAIAAMAFVERARAMKWMGRA